MLTLKEKIADAEYQYHLLSTGRSAKVVVDQNGERVEYASASISRLATYIQTMKRGLSSSGANRGPMRFWN